MNPKRYRLPLLAAAGDSLPKLKLHDLQGERQSLNPYRRKLIVLNFWATWYGPGKEEMPMLVEKEARYHDRGAVVIGAIDRFGSNYSARRASTGSAEAARRAGM